ncbi:unnamed protein product [Victoria cruziana]
MRRATPSSRLREGL